MAQSRELVYENKPYTSVSALAKYLGIKRSTLSVNLNKYPDLTVEEVVSKIKKLDKPVLFIIDGVEYRSMNSLSKAVGISAKILNDRVESGMSMEEAIKTPVKSVKKPVVYDGVEYESISDLMRAHGLDLDTYNRRRRIGWTLEQIVSTPLYSKGTGKACSVTYRGETYPSYAQLAEAYGVKYSTFLSRLNSGLSLQDCLQDYMLDENGQMIKYT